MAIKKLQGFHLYFKQCTKCPELVKFMGHFVHGEKSVLWCTYHVKYLKIQILQMFLYVSWHQRQISIEVHRVYI